MKPPPIRKTRPPPGPVRALLISLLICPGAAQIRLGHRKTGWALILLFLGVFGLYIRQTVLPLLAYVAALLDAGAEPVMPAEPGENLLWHTLLLAVYFGIAAHAVWLAWSVRRRRAAEEPPNSADKPGDTGI